MSPAFEHTKQIPQKYTCQGEDISPELTFQDIPLKTTSLVLIMDDPDAPGGTFDHWICWNIPAEIHHLQEGVSLTHQGNNSYGKAGYKGPCPPPGAPHRYFFKLYALDIVLSLEEGCSKIEVETAMKDHLLAKTELIGIYQRA